MVHLYLTETDIKEIEYMIIDNNICRTMKDINRILEKELKDDNKSISTQKVSKITEKSQKISKRTENTTKVIDKFKNNKYYKYNKDDKYNKY
jgi:hypothetical protein